MFFVFLVHFLFSLTFGMARGVVHISQPLFFVGVRMIVAGGVLLGWRFFQGDSIIKHLKQHLPSLILLAIFNVFLHNAPEFWAMQFIPSRKASLIYSMCPFLTALLSHWMFQERLLAIQWLGMIIGAIGFAGVFEQAAPCEAFAGGFGSLSWAELAMVTAACSSVIGWLILKRISTASPDEVVTSNGLSMLIGGVFTLATSAAIECWHSVPVVTNIPLFMLYLVGFILVSNVIGYNLYGALLKTHSATLLSFTGFIQPLFAALVDVLFFGDTLYPSFFVTFCIIGLGLALFLKPEFQQAR